MFVVLIFVFIKNDYTPLTKTTLEELFQEGYLFFFFAVFFFAAFFAGFLLAAFFFAAMLEKVLFFN